MVRHGDGPKCGPWQVWFHFAYISYPLVWSPASGLGCEAEYPQGREGSDRREYSHEQKFAFGAECQAQS